MYDFLFLEQTHFGVTCAIDMNETSDYTILLKINVKKKGIFTVMP